MYSRKAFINNLTVNCFAEHFCILGDFQIFSKMSMNARMTSLLILIPLFTLLIYGIRKMDSMQSILLSDKKSGSKDAPEPVNAPMVLAEGTANLGIDCSWAEKYKICQFFIVVF